MKLLIGIPTSIHKNYCFDEVIANVLAMGHDYIIVDNSDQINTKLKNYIHDYASHNKSIRQAIVNSQNKIREIFLANNYTHLAFLESDLVPPIDTYKKLSLYDLPVVGHPYFVMKGSLRQYMIHDMVYLEHKHKAMQTPTDIDKGFLITDGSLRRVYSVGLGCILIKREVLENIHFHIETSEQMQDGLIPSSSDSFFASDCLINNIPIYADTSRTIMHYNKNWN